MKAPLSEGQKVLQTRPRYPDGLYHVKVQDVTEKTVQVQGQDRVAFNWHYEILEGPPGTNYVGKPMYESMLIGTEASPDGKDPKVWDLKGQWQDRGMHARDFIQRMDSAGVKLGEDTDEAIALVRGQELVIMLGTEPETNKKGEPNPRAGQAKFLRSYSVKNAPKMVPNRNPIVGTFPRPNGPAATPITED